MSGKAIIAQVTVRPHPNADNIQLGDVLGFQVVIGKEVKTGDLGVFFMEGLQLSEEYAAANNLVRKTCPETGKNIGGFFEENRRVRAQKFRGEKSEGYFAPLSSLEFATTQPLKAGEQFEELGGKKICGKYFTPATFRMQGKKHAGSGYTTMFHKHKDTEQLRFNSYKMRVGSYVSITLKMHGTSQRTGYVLDETPKSWWQSVLGYFGLEKRRWVYLTGSRNIILKDLKDGFRFEAAQNFAGKLFKGETVFYEIVGYEYFDRPIMQAHNPSDKELKKKWGDSIVYNYGCVNGQFDVYVYRITKTDEDGHSVDLPWYEVKKRCGQMGVKHVPEMYPSIVLNDELTKSILLKEIENISDGQDPIGNHPREGVCVRVNDEIFKYKGFTFGVLEGYIKNDKEYVDTEEVA